MSLHLNQDQHRIWQDALAAVQETAANTDHESSSKHPMLMLAEQVRREPDAVLRELALIRMEPMVNSIDPTTSEAMLAAVQDRLRGALTRRS